MANENKPLVEAKPGDPITAGRWNDMQRALRQEHIQHTHTGVWKDGLFDGAPITEAGLAAGAVTTTRLADNAVTGTKVDPSSDVRVRKLSVSGQNLAADASALEVTGPLKVIGPTTLGSLKVSGTSEHASLNVTGPTTLTSLKSGPSEHASLNVTGATTLTGLKVSATSEHASLNVTNSLLVQGRNAVVAEGAMPRIVWGNIGPEAEIYGSSNGFKVSRLANGDTGFLIVFDTPFTSWPAVIVQQMGEGNTKNNALVRLYEKSQMYVYTGDSEGKKEHRPFSFLAIGLG